MHQQAVLQLGNRAADQAAKTAAKQLSKAYCWPKNIWCVFSWGSCVHICNDLTMRWWHKMVLAVFWTYLSTLTWKMPKHTEYRKRHTNMHTLAIGGQHIQLCCWTGYSPLKWSKQYDKQSNGISWFEFAVNFVLTTQRNITVSVRQKHETKRYVSTIEDPAFDISTFTMVDVTNSFRAVGKHIHIFFLKLAQNDRHRTFFSLFVRTGQC